MARTSRYLNAGGFEIHLSEWGRGEWGRADAPTVVMWHGLARTGRDFDDLAAHMCERYRVIAPDTIGRGLSQWANDRERDYCFDVYGRIAVDLLDQLGVDELRWVGTSMGGLIGATLAAGPLKGRISHLLLNDIGPDVPEAARERIGAYVGNPPRFETVSAYEDWIRTVYTPFGEHDDATWRHLAETSCRRTGDGKITVHYDPKIVTQFTNHKADLDIWPAYDAIDCPTLVMRGQTSDVLARDTAHEMTRRGPRATLVEIDGVGHAPVLNDAAQRAIVEDFLAA